MVGENSSEILKVTRRAKPEKEIQKIIHFMYHSDLYIQGRGLVPLSALADSSHLPRKLDLSKATVFFFIGKKISIVYILFSFQSPFCVSTRETMDADIFAVSGCPGSGKSSVAVDFAAGGQYIHLSPSAILANIARNGPYPDQQVVEAAIATFKEVPDELLVLLTIREIQTHVESGSKLFIVDGFPQNTNQFKLISRVSSIRIIFPCLWGPYILASVFAEKHPVLNSGCENGICYLSTWTSRQFLHVKRYQEPRLRNNSPGMRHS